MKRILVCLGLMLVFGLVFLAGVVTGQQTYGMPKTVIHVAKIQWKEDSTGEQRDRAIQGVKEMAATIPGIKNIWLSPDRVQPREFHTAFVIEFENREAADVYAEHPAHDKWNEFYQTIRERSESLQITNR